LWSFIKRIKKTIYIADPAVGKIKLKRKDFEKAWLSDTDRGVLILLEPTPQFYEEGTGLNDLNNPYDKSNKARLTYLFAYLRPHRRLIINLLMGMALGSGFQLIFPFLTQSVVDVGITNRNIGFIYIALIGQLVLFISQMTVQFLQSKILLFVGARLNVALLNDFLVKLMRLPLGFFDAKTTGDLMQRMGDQSRIEAFLTGSTLPVIFSTVNFIIFSCVLFLYSPFIFSIFGIAAILYIVWILIFLKRRRDIDYARFNTQSANQTNLIEMIQGMPEIKLQGSEDKRRDKWRILQNTLYHINWKALNLGQWQDAGATFISNGKDILITFIAANAVIEGKMTLGMMMATQYMVGQLQAPLQQWIAFIRAAQDAKISMERMGEIHNQEDENSTPVETRGIASHPQNDIETRGIASLHPDFAGTDILIENLSFKYNALDDEVLKDINLSIPQGKVTAIVGTSGSGKTTLVRLLLGFYKPTKGSIKIGNSLLTGITPSVWRSQCGAVLQDGFIFSDTIANNIAESEQYIDRAKLLQAVKIANIQEYIEELPMGYNTSIGSKGKGLSQGQRQRLIIARAVYKNPQFLFFDEATNALDANNERVIVENLQTFFQNRTVVVVAHRLSTVKNADQIVVLEKGEIVEIGTHTELVEKKGAYFHLVKNQLELGE
jgi:ATP-binding cassette subfamily B protein